MHEAEGRYAFDHGHFVPQGSMDEINRLLSEMQLVVESGPQADHPSAPFFYRDPNGQYWRYEEHEDYTAELETVGRAWIERHYPDMNLNRLVDVRR